MNGKDVPASDDVLASGASLRKPPQAWSLARRILRRELPCREDRADCLVLAEVDLAGQLTQGRVRRLRSKLPWGALRGTHQQQGGERNADRRDGARGRCRCTGIEVDHRAGKAAGQGEAAANANAAVMLDTQILYSLASEEVRALLATLYGIYCEPGDAQAL